jgi:hypothetical protein
MTVNSLTIDDFIAAVRAIAMADGVAADDAYWRADAWRARYADGLAPAEAWDVERHPALRAL